MIKMQIEVPSEAPEKVDDILETFLKVPIQRFETINFDPPLTLLR